MLTNVLSCCCFFPHAEIVNAKFYEHSVSSSSLDSDSDSVDSTTSLQQSDCLDWRDIDSRVTWSRVPELPIGVDVGDHEWLNEHFYRIHCMQNITDNAPFQCVSGWVSCLPQSIVGLKDLGQFRRPPFKDSAGSVIFVAVRHVTDACKNANKSVYVRWMPVDKLQVSSLSLRGLQAYDSDTSAFDIVTAAVRVRSANDGARSHICDKS